MHVEHRSFVNHHRIRLQRVVRRAHEAALSWVILKESVDCIRGAADGLRENIRRSRRRRGQKHFLTLGPPSLNDRPYGERLASARTTRKDHQLAHARPLHCLMLKRRERLQRRIQRRPRPRRPHPRPQCRRVGARPIDETQRANDVVVRVGFVGIVVLMGLYLFVVFRALFLTSQMRDTFSRLLSGSLAAIFFVYVFVNAGMVSGLLPVVGVPLPLVSYGGTSMVTLLAGFGMLMSLYANRKLAG